MPKRTRSPNIARNATQTIRKTPIDQPFFPWDRRSSYEHPSTNPRIVSSCQITATEFSGGTGNKTAAAKALGISLRTLYNKLEAKEPLEQTQSSAPTADIEPASD